MTVAAVLLAGGDSRRMGRDKATMLVRGERLWKRQLQLIAQLQPTVVFISARRDPPWRPHDTFFVADAAPSRGPLSGLAATLQVMAATHLLAVAIDMPHMPVSYLKLLLSYARPAIGVIPRIGDRAEPLAAVYPKEAASDFADALRGRRWSLQQVATKVVAAQKMTWLPVGKNEERFFANINTPTDLVAAEASL